MLPLASMMAEEIAARPAASLFVQPMVAQPPRGTATWFQCTRRLEPPRAALAEGGHYVLRKQLHRPHHLLVFQPAEAHPGQPVVDPALLDEGPDTLDDLFR